MFGWICRFVVTANGLAAAYSLVQVMRCVLGMIRGNVLFSKPLAWAIFSGDQVYFDCSDFKILSCYLVI